MIRAPASLPRKARLALFALGSKAFLEIGRGQAAIRQTLRIGTVDAGAGSLLNERFHALHREGGQTCQTGGKLLRGTIQL